MRRKACRIGLPFRPFRGWTTLAGFRRCGNRHRSRGDPGFLTGPSLLVLLAGMFAVYLVFPFVLLSMMDMGNVLQPFSAEVARSVTDSQEAWGGLYFSSAILFAALFLLIVSMNGLAGHSGIAISLTASIAVVFIYFGMIGRLASAIGQADDESGGSAEE